MVLPTAVVKDSDPKNNFEPQTLYKCLLTLRCRLEIFFCSHQSTKQTPSSSFAFKCTYLHLLVKIYYTLFLFSFFLIHSNLQIMHKTNPQTTHSIIEILINQNVKESSFCIRIDKHPE